MQVFKAFFITVNKEKVSLIIYFCIFLALSLMMTGNTKKQTEAVYNDTQVEMAVLDRDNTVLSKSLYKYLEKTQKLVTIKDNKDSITDELFFRNVEYVMIIKEGFEESIKSGNYENVIENFKVPDSVSGKLLDTKINQYISALSAYVAGGFSVQEAADKALETADMTVNVDILKVEGKEVERRRVYYYYTYIPYVLICIMLSDLGNILLTFRKKELNWRIQCSAFTRARRNGALISASLLFGLAILSIFVLFSFILYKDDMMNIKGLLYIINGLIFLVIAMSMAYFVSFLLKTKNALDLISNTLGLGLSFLGGIFVPLEYMSNSVLRFSKLLPTYWYVMTNQVIEAFNSSQEQYHIIYKYMGIQALFAFILLGATIVVQRFRLVEQGV